MAIEGVPIQVKIGLKPNGHADYPDWTQLPLQKVGKVKHETHQIQKWIYDKTSGHDDDTVESPVGQQFGMMVVTQQFADEAVITFPGLVTVMTELEAQEFYENKGTAHMPIDRIDSEFLVGLKAQRDLMIDLKVDSAQVDTLDLIIGKALDPNDNQIGVRKNGQKTWADVKVKKGFTIKAP